MTRLPYEMPLDPEAASMAFVSYYTIDAIEHLNFAVYRLDEYGVETGEKETSAQLRQRNSNFVGIMRTILLERMESSLAVLTSTVRSLVDYFNLFLERFAPLAAHRGPSRRMIQALLRKIEPLRAQSIELLIATDVLSEGQNFQEAQFLVNYDLPWNPVRMIQRAGRIDRLFSPHDRVYIYNLMPEDGLEDLLNLVANLSKKIETIGDAVALDASVLGEQIETKELDKVMNVGNQQKWHTLVPERSEVGWRSGELPEDPVVLSSPFDCLSLYLLSAL